MPRVPLRIPVEILHRGESWQAETTDLGPGGCLVSSPRPLVERAQLRVILRCQRVPAALNVPACVAWARAALGGVAFTPRHVGAGPHPEAWFHGILEANPGLATGIGRVPERLALDAPLYLLPAPREVVDLAPDERALLARATNGMTVRALLASAALTEERVVKAVFALFDKDVLTLSAGQAGEVWKWRAAVGAAPEDRPPAPPWPVVASAAPARTGVARLARLEVGPSTPDRNLLRGAGASSRPAEAQARLDRARAAAAAKRIDQAVALLRQALALAPRDAEIARLLGDLAFKDRVI